MSRFDEWSKFIGDIARPLSIMAVSFAGAAACVIASMRIENGNDGALLIGAVFVGIGALYGAKSMEVWKTHRADADVKIAGKQNEQSSGE